MILIMLDNGDGYDSHGDWPAVFCPDWDTARAAEKEWNTWHKDLRAFFKKKPLSHADSFELRASSYEDRRVWLKQNPPPFWSQGGLYGNAHDSLCDYFIDLVELHIYEPKATP